MKISDFRYILLVGVLLWGRLLFAQPEAFNHPELVWKSIETEHFVVTYHQGTERTANLVAKIAEEIYPHITGLYQYEPPAKTEFIIRDTDDYSNGGAYFYDNKVEIWAENLDYILRGTHNWLRDVVTHEYTHIVSMQKALKFGMHVPAGWFQVFAYEEERRKDVVRGFPDVLVSYPISGINIPVWFAEGTAQFQSPSMRFDYRDSHREMILRDRVVTGKLLDFNEMSVFGKNSIGNESSYNQGFAFVRFLAQTFGDSVVGKLAGEAASWKNLNFKQVIHRVTGRNADDIFRSWKEYLQETYTRRLHTVQQHLKIGEPFVKEGIGNIHPIFSPDGKKLAYLKAQGDYLSMNVLVVADLKTGKKRSVAGPVASSISWSPDGRYLTYARHTRLQPNGSSFNDIYIYDTKRGREFQITRALRATNPDWSHDGKRLAFVVHSDGLTNLFVLELEELELIKKKEFWHTAYYDLNEHHLVNQIPSERRKHWKQYYRKVRYWGRDIRQLTHFTDGRQIFHPRWAPDDSYLVFDTSIKFGRDIARIPADGGEMEFILNARYDERYPSFDPKTGELYFACDKTGIFNIYSLNLKTGETEAHTNVVGGAFMPTVNQDGTLFYALYKDQGYKIYRIDQVNSLPEEYLEYDRNYQAKIPEIPQDDRVVQPLPSRPYRRTCGPVGSMPRLVID
jgi:Tol biopolymer transport system component